MSPEIEFDIWSVYLCLFIGVQSHHWGPGGNAVSLCHEGYAPNASAWRAPAESRLPHTCKTSDRQNYDSGKWEISQDFLTAQPLPQPTSQFPNSLSKTGDAAGLSGVCEQAIQPHLTSSKPLVLRWPLWFSRGEFKCFSCIEFNLEVFHLKMQNFPKLYNDILTFLQDQDKEYVGFATLPNQVNRKAVKKGFMFTIMVAGKVSCLSVYSSNLSIL